MKKIVFIILIFCSVYSYGQSETAMLSEFTRIFSTNMELVGTYEISSYITPKFLCSDFNGDNNKDIAVLVINRANKKRGFIIMHGESKNMFTVGAGVVYDSEDGWDDMDWIDKWEINTIRDNEPGIQEGDKLSLNYDSIKITKKEVGGGLIYWDGEKYTYFHQTC